LNKKPNLPPLQSNIPTVPVKTVGLPKYNIGSSFDQNIGQTPVSEGIKGTTVKSMPVETQTKIAEEVKPNVTDSAIPSNIEVKKEMGVTFPHIELEKENMLKQRLKQDMPDATPEERLTKAQSIVK